MNISKQLLMLDSNNFKSNLQQCILMLDSNNFKSNLQQTIHSQMIKYIHLTLCKQITDIIFDFLALFNNIWSHLTGC